MRELSSVVEEATKLRRRGAQIDHVLSGLVDIVVRHRALGALFSSDPGIARAIEKSLRSSDNFKDRLVSLLVGPDPDIDGAIAARVLFAGIAMAGGSPEFADVEDERLRTALIDAGRRFLGRQRRRGH